MKVLTVFGTRPEAIKLAPVIKALVHSEAVESYVCVTGQHRQMLDQMLKLFDIKPDIDLDIMQPNQTLSDITALMLTKLSTVFAELKPAWVIVQGDTTTAFVAALAAFYHKIPVAHVEAGLRTHNRYFPWPEEINRKLVTDLATLHFTPTAQATANLIAENIDKNTIFTTGNTVIDALLATVQKLITDKNLSAQCEQQFSFLDKNKKLILVTGHRRENFGAGMQAICHALAELAQRPDIQIVYPVHLNPAVQTPVKTILQGSKNIYLIEPLDYLPFVYLMQACTLILTDSGGVQEEAPALGKPVLVMRDVTERPEAIAAGGAKLVGTDAKNIVKNVNKLLDDKNIYQTMSQASNPYGDGQAADRIVEKIISHEYA